MYGMHCHTVARHGLQKKENRTRLKLLKYRYGKMERTKWVYGVVNKKVLKKYRREEHSLRHS